MKAVETQRVKVTPFSHHAPLQIWNSSIWGRTSFRHPQREVHQCGRVEGAIRVRPHRVPRPPTERSRVRFRCVRLACVALVDWRRQVRHVLRSLSLSTATCRSGRDGASVPRPRRGRDRACTSYARLRWNCAKSSDVRPNRSFGTWYANGTTTALRSVR